ncbi:MAG: sigma-70 family RNA polymerase sigma factor [Paraglaciecola sp.]|uniref:RNA polymerase sigma factor n=1 Tax=Pseudomonadati TaxID=3379134 RepID=UPI00273DEA6A|nr:sigma-70 family RNA polymerase sigma factor [Paraglaciecola sp.]MDP5030793.1 sigma-70 family RNA polymerase sigma factor [Paraglaciecola sp.]MDP5040454.1 sigma-70 family RNA polymerase sigma factor [Paraglaciecola sp.]MDP5132143.1 sigma-70 family RNA polymerase sigma factor [Paraglaciecola sp.]
MSQDFNSILSEYGALLSRVATSYEANHHLRQELLQEISLAVWQSLRTFKGDSSLKTYILRVAHNRAISHVAYHIKTPKSASYCEMTQASPSPTASSETTMAQQQQVTTLLNEVRKLPIQTRQIVTLSMEGLSYQDIAEVCGIKVTNVGVILNRSKKVLLEAIKHEQ